MYPFCIHPPHPPPHTHTHTHTPHTDDTRKMSTLQLLAGYLQLLGPHIISLTYSHPHLTRITQALIQVSSRQPRENAIEEKENQSLRIKPGASWSLASLSCQCS